MGENDTRLNAEVVFKKGNYLLILIGLFMFLLFVIVEMVVIAFRMHEPVFQSNVLFCEFIFETLPFQTFAATSHK